MVWKGRVSFKQYMPLKASKFGIKTYELCDTTTGNLWPFLVYTGKDTKLDSPLIPADTSKTSAIVLKLVEPPLKQGRTVWMDNFYNSPALAKTLKMTYKTECVGILKLNHKDVPPKVKNAKLKKGEIVAQHAGPVSVTKWSDKKIVTMISTYHSHEIRTVTIRGKETVKSGRAIAQAVSRRLPTAAAGHLGFCDGQKWRGGMFPLPIYIPSASPQSSSLSTEAGTIRQEWLQCQ
jgi:hypothetical protein